MTDARPGPAAPPVDASPVDTPQQPATQQPWLHDLVAAVAAPTQLWTGPDGQLRRSGAQGAWQGDVRVLSRAELLVGDVEPVPVLARPAGSGAALAVGIARHLGDPTPDPTVRVDRHRQVTPGTLTERVTVASTASAPVTTTLRLLLECDLASMDRVKTGLATPPVPPTAGDTPGWAGSGVQVRVDAPGATVRAAGEGLELTWTADVPPGGVAEVTWTVRAADERAVVAAPAEPADWELSVAAGDARLDRWVTRALEDLAALRMVCTDAPSEPFVAAGAPWFLTLFGRDSLWAARMMLPLGTGIAGSTLRLLASRQGRRVDVDSAEEPGKILHELRRDAFDLPDDPAGALHLPPVYYGTVDATALWVLLLHDAWRWGLPAAEVEPLLGHLEAALTWLADFGDSDGDGFLEYVDASGRGLANQGWKDSGDSVQWRDGRLAEGPIALCEVQGYAYEAAVGGAALLEAFGRPGADRWREWAAGLQERFRRRFWVSDADGPYPAIALDAAKNPVDSLTSNAGHLLGTGLLSAEEEAAVAVRMAAPDMDSGFGLRTLSTTAGGFSPLSYHGGSVWPHDTAIVLAGAARAGQHVAAAGLIEGLLAAAEAFDFRLPELYGGDARRDVPSPVPYPAACRPQAWSAAAALAAVSALTGLRPDVPAGTLTAGPLAPSPVGALRVAGLRVAGRPVAVEVAADGRLGRLDAPAALSVEAGILGG